MLLASTLPHNRPNGASLEATIKASMIARIRCISIRRSLHTTARRNVDATFSNRPSPPRLPAHLQKEFEELQRKAVTPLASSSSNAGQDEVAAIPQGEEVHPDMRRKPKPEFDGDVNPRTGEVGGPKNDPLGYEKEWTYGGRATDF